jgi:hypothetical protein
VGTDCFGHARSFLGWQVSERLRVVPLTVKAAKRLVKRWHRHLSDIQGGLFAVAIVSGREVVGVAVAGNPPRVWQGKGKFVIARVAVRELTRNGCSKLYGAICRAGQALGYCEAWTYTLPEEPGTSLLAAGFEDMGTTAGGEWTRPSRPRGKAKRAEPKRRWRRVLQSECIVPEVIVDAA